MAGQAELTSRQRRSLAEDGYLLLPSVLAADVVATLAVRLDELARAIIAEADAAVGEQGEQWEEAGVVSVRLEPADPGYGPLVRQPLLFSLWHSGTLNYSPGLRLAVTTYLSAPARASPA